jgi:glycosyltransferase involved in cell wall biosynthesis
MKIAIDVSPLHSAHQYRGIGSYTRNLIGSLKAIDKKNEYFLIANDKELNRLKPDIVHYPYFDFFQLTLPLMREKPTIVTIYDVIPLIFPEHFPPGLKGRVKLEIQKHSLNGVKAIITISEASKKDIIKYLEVPKEKVFVTYLAPGKEFKKFQPKAGPPLAEKIRQKYHLPEVFVFYVGDVNWHKNIPGLIKVMAKINPAVSLVLAGKAFMDEELKETKEILQLIKEPNLINRVKLLGYLPESELVAIYNLASVYCQPSFYEGFGLPVLEAMACGCPVVAAKAGSLPEICKEAAIMIDPYDISDIARGINRVVENKSIRNDLINKGFKQENKFSWEKTARETLAVYNRVYAQKRG